MLAHLRAQRDINHVKKIFFLPFNSATIPSGLGKPPGSGCFYTLSLSPQIHSALGPEEAVGFSSLPLRLVLLLSVAPSFPVSALSVFTSTGLFSAVLSLVPLSLQPLPIDP